jgi:hypothetical protein
MDVLAQLIQDIVGYDRRVAGPDDVAQGLLPEIGVAKAREQGARVKEDLHGVCRSKAKRASFD